MFEMANLSPKTTGLPFVVWISPRLASHSARVKVSPGPRANANRMVSVTIDEPISVVAGKWTLGQDDFDALAKWIRLNHKVLLAFWNGDLLYTEDVLPLLKPVTAA